LINIIYKVLVTRFIKIIIMNIAHLSFQPTSISKKTTNILVRIIKTIIFIFKF
jgi:hypothetical protein